MAEKAITMKVGSAQKLAAGKDFAKTGGNEWTLVNVDAKVVKGATQAGKRILDSVSCMVFRGADGSHYAQAVGDLMRKGPRK